MDVVVLSGEESDLFYEITHDKIRCIYKGFFNDGFKDDKIDCYSVNLVSGGTYFIYEEDNYYYEIDNFFKYKIRDLKIDKLLK